MSRSLEDLLPQVKEKALQHDEDCREEGIQLIFSETYRSPEEQQIDWLKGRDENGNVVDPHKVVTHAKPWQSWHQLRRAYDVVPKDKYGKPFWNHYANCAAIHTNKPCNCGFDDIWMKVGLIGEACGLEWGGRWIGKKLDRPHFELKQGLTLAEAREQLEQRDAQADGIKQ